MSGSTLILIALLILALVYLSQSFTAKDDPQEPPVVPPKIPVIGHLIGLLRDGQGYHAKISAQNPHLPIYTMKIVFGKIFVVNSPSMVNAVQRHQHTLSFTPFMAASTVRTLGFKGAGAERLLEDPDDGRRYMDMVTDHMHAPLLGDGLDRMNETLLRRFKPLVDELAAAGTSSPSGLVDLFAWCRHAVTVAATSAVYGPKNPFGSAEVESAFWAFERGVLPLFINFLPGITAREPHRARDRVLRALEEYMENAGYAEAGASELAYARWKCQRDAGVPLPDIARLECGMLFGLLANWGPTTFWVLFDIYSRPKLLQELRKEARENALSIQSDGKHVVDLGDIRDKCPLLVATLQETLRLRTIASPVRKGKNDVLLADKYKIKAGSIIQMPGAALSRNKEVWGEGATDFDPWRFVKGSGGPGEGKKTTSFLAFGTVPNMCPGRHFASGGVLAVAAMVLLRFDMLPERGEWKEPRASLMALLPSLHCPVDGYKVRVTARNEWKGAEWGYRSVPGKGKFGLVTG